jgi:DNA-binding FadR family transcriptional regulator
MNNCSGAMLGGITAFQPARNSVANPTLDRVYEFLCDYVDKHHESPSVKEIAYGIGKSRPTVQHAIEILEARGRVTRQRHKRRTVIPVRQNGNGI